MDPQDGRPPIVRWTLRLEGLAGLDEPVRAVEPWVRSLVGTGVRGAALRGTWLGHAVHPVLTDLVVGTWTSASVLDLLGGRGSSAAAQKLVATGLLAAGPTVATGWAEWSAAGPRAQRVGIVHAASNALAVGTYAASWLARRNGNHRAGAALSLTGLAVSGLGAYLGGHLAAARKVSSHDPAYDRASSG